MSESPDTKHLLPTSVPTLDTLAADGIALCAQDLRLLYHNAKFAEWFPAAGARLGAPVDQLIETLSIKRALKRLQRRGYYDLDLDLDEHDQRESQVRRPLLLALSFSALTWEGHNFIQIHARDNTQLKEKDAIINSHTRMLEKSNRELQRKTRLLEEKNDQLSALSSKLGKYLSPQVYQSIFTGENQVKVETYRKQLTVFFSDIQGFTELTDSLEPELLASVLNHYLQEMSEIAHKYGGTVDKFIGDGILIFFGDPKTKGKKEDALASVMMALEMRERMVALRGYWRGMGVTRPLHVRMGINSGYCTVGNFGSDKRMEYTVVGGHVNLASRLESIAATDEILISEQTHALLEGKIECEDRGEVTLKGLAAPVRVFNVIDFNFERMESRDVRLKEEFEGFSLRLDLIQTDKERAIVTLRRLINKLELELLTPKTKVKELVQAAAAEAADAAAADAPQPE